jgi:hypothetical protein
MALSTNFSGPARLCLPKTYPAECYGWFFAEPLRGKGKQEIRRQVSQPLLSWAESIGLGLEASLTRAIAEGFPEGDDAFDTVVGLFGMVEVVIGRRQPGEPDENKIRNRGGLDFGPARQVVRTNLSTRP